MHSYIFSIHLQILTFSFFIHFLQGCAHHYCVSQDIECHHYTLRRWIFDPNFKSIPKIMIEKLDWCCIPYRQYFSHVMLAKNDRAFWKYTHKLQQIKQLQRKPVRSLFECMYVLYIYLPKLNISLLSSKKDILVLSISLGFVTTSHSIHMSNFTKI